MWRLCSATEAEPQAIKILIHRASLHEPERDRAATTTAQALVPRLTVLGQHLQ